MSDFQNKRLMANRINQQVRYLEQKPKLDWEQISEYLRVLQKRFEQPEFVNLRQQFYDNHIVSSLCYHCIDEPLAEIPEPNSWCYRKQEVSSTDLYMRQGTKISFKNSTGILVEEAYVFVYLPGSVGVFVDCQGHGKQDFPFVEFVFLSQIISLEEPIQTETTNLEFVNDIVVDNTDDDADNDDVNETFFPYLQPNNIPSPDTLLTPLDEQLCLFQLQTRVNELVSIHSSPLEPWILLNEDVTLSPYHYSKVMANLICQEFKRKHAERNCLHVEIVARDKALANLRRCIFEVRDKVSIDVTCMLTDAQESHVRFHIPAKWTQWESIKVLAYELHQTPGKLVNYKAKKLQDDKVEQLITRFTDYHLIMKHIADGSTIACLKRNEHCLICWNFPSPKPISLECSILL